MLAVSPSPCPSSWGTFAVVVVAAAMSSRPTGAGSAAGGAGTSFCILMRTTQLPELCSSTEAAEADVAASAIDGVCFTRIDIDCSDSSGLLLISRPAPAVSASGDLKSVSGGNRLRDTEPVFVGACDCELNTE